VQSLAPVHKTGVFLAQYHGFYIMQYEIEFKPKAVRDLESLDREVARRILGKIERMKENLAGDVKRLTNFSPEYRLRVGDYRVLFEVESNVVVIYRVVHRREAYER
jgi:mRNA interferase RelE/StbE